MMAEHGEPEGLRDYDSEPPPQSARELASDGLVNLLGNLGWVALDPTLPGPVVRAFAGLRQVIGPKPFYMNQEVAADYAAQSKRTMFASKGHRQDGDVVTAFGVPSVADLLCRLGFARTPGNHLDFVTDERTGRTTAKADAWTFDETADLPLYSRASLDLLKGRQEGLDHLEKNKNNPRYEGQICDFLTAERLNVLSRPSAEGWSQPGGSEQKKARKFNDTAFRLWLVLLSFFPETPLLVNASLIAQMFAVDDDTARRALAYLVNLTVVEPEPPTHGSRSRQYRWDLRGYLGDPYRREAIGHASGGRVGHPWRNASLGNQPLRRGGEHVDKYFSQTYATDAARKKGIGMPFRVEPTSADLGDAKL